MNEEGIIQKDQLYYEVKWMLEERQWRKLKMILKLLPSV